MDESPTLRSFRVPDRSPAVILLIVLLIVLQVVLAGIVAVQARRIFDLGERIERLEKKQPLESK
ncbi:MAG TPA: hypothetical protein VH682_01635 [Gemmataceae bacterium]